MMHGIFSNLTAILLAVHTVLGCCWHHAHDGVETCETAAAVASSDCAECDHAHPSSTPSNSDNQGQHGRHDCQGSTCVFVNSSKVDRHGLTVQFDVSPVVLNVDSIFCEPVGERPFYTICASDALLPPLRLCVVYQVWLI